MDSVSLHDQKDNLTTVKYILIFSLLIALSSCRNKVIQYPVSYEDDRDKFMEFSQKFNKEILSNENRLIQEFIANSPLEFNPTSYGFWISNEGKPNDEMAKAGDFVKYEYEVSDFDGKMIYTEDEIGIRETVLGRENLPRGLHISLQLIEKGDSAVSLFPSFMAYGSYGDRNEIVGNEPLVFKIKVLEIKKREK